MFAEGLTPLRGFCAARRSASPFPALSARVLSHSFLSAGTVTHTSLAILQLFSRELARLLRPSRLPCMVSFGPCLGPVSTLFALAAFLVAATLCLGIRCLFLFFSSWIARSPTPFVSRLMRYFLYLVSVAALWLPFSGASLSGANLEPFLLFPPCTRLHIRSKTFFGRARALCGVV